MGGHSGSTSFLQVPCHFQTAIGLMAVTPLALFFSYFLSKQEDMEHFLPFVPVL